MAHRFLIVLGVVFFFISIAHATEFTSSNFQVLDPVIQPGGFSTSSGFQLTGVITQIGIGTSTASSFGLRGGFLFFPTVTTPSLTATAGDAQVSLSWTAAEAFQAVVDHYDVGQSTTAGGSYTFTDVGNVLASTRTGLTNGTTYYFVVRVMDEQNFAMATSSEVSKAPVAGEAAPTPTPAAGGGGGIVLSLLALFLPPVPALPPPPIPDVARVADLNNDGRIGLRDLSIFLYFSVTEPPRVDFNRDGKTGAGDISILFYGWTPPAYPLALVEARRDVAALGDEGELLGSFSDRSQLAIISPVAPEGTAKEAPVSARGMFSRAADAARRLFHAVINFFR
ncbi:MAG: hypothetical protein HYT22_03330 [Candidatus Niyogibacteria bacterium]|nr:hypothetical protein [Candidatus Niyogibacteria bacterium]